jgi:hypothetical protein
LGGGLTLVKIFFLAFCRSRMTQMLLALLVRTLEPSVPTYQDGEPYLHHIFFILAKKNNNKNIYN